ncbi:5627_t:CDS:2, partial [Funneliformis caledonium]
MENEDMDTQKRIRFASTISSMYDVQTQMIVMIQDIQKKIGKSLGFDSHTENDTKWID